MTALSICVGVLGCGVLGFACYVCYTKIWLGKIKAEKFKESDERLMEEAHYEANRESVEIIEGRDHLNELKRRVLVNRLQAGVERVVEDIGFTSDDDSLAEIFSFGKHHKSLGEIGKDSQGVTMLD